MIWTPLLKAKDILGDSLTFPMQAQKVQLTTELAEELDDIGDITFQGLNQGANGGFGGLHLGAPAQVQGDPKLLTSDLTQHGPVGLTPMLSQYGKLPSDLTQHAGRLMAIWQKNRKFTKFTKNRYFNT